MPFNEQLQQELIKDLLLECHEGLERYDHALLAMEQGQGDDTTLNEIFRTVHTIKGSAGCLGLTRIERTAHAGENLLSLLRDRALVITPEMITALLALSDALRGLLRTLETTGNDGDSEPVELLAQLERLQKPSALPATGRPQAAAETPAPAATVQPPATSHGSATTHFGLFDDEPDAPAQGSAAFGLFDDEPAAASASSTPVASRPAAPTSASPSASAASEPAAARGSVADNAIRIDITQLDKVMNLVGELVLARNQIVANTTRFDQASLAAASQRLNIITTELQENVMKTRMQPIGNVWGKFPRVVRDVARELGKKVHLVMEGQSTELDRTIVEAIKDPLTHIIRNSVDHGIEMPERRLTAGKAETGLLSLRAYHEGGQVNIEIMDDGGGIDIERVKAKAVALHLISAEQGARLSERDALDLIFHPGLSTASAVTNLSGRGVGMDVVKTNIEKIGGSIDIQSQPGQGTCIKIKIPLTLAIIPALLVSSGGQRFAIPQVSLLELVRLEGAQATRGIERVHDTAVYRLRGQLLPLVYLNQQLRTATSTAAPVAAGADAVVNIVVLQADGHRFGLVVDRINDTEEIVVKPLGQQLKGIATFAGATILGDGRVALILDVVGLAQHSRVLGELHDRPAAVDATRGAHAADTRQSLLVFNAGQGRRLALPLAQAARLEEIPRARIERADGREVVQYRGQILPLIRVSDHVAGGGAQPESSTDTLQVIVYNAEEGRSHGFVVEQICDIIEENVAVSRTSTTPGLLGSLVVQGKVTDLLDAPALIRLAETRGRQPSIAA